MQVIRFRAAVRWVYRWARLGARRYPWMSSMISRAARWPDEIAPCTVPAVALVSAASPAYQMVRSTGRVSRADMRAPPTRAYEYAPRENGSLTQSCWYDRTSRVARRVGVMRNIDASDSIASRSSSRAGRPARSAAREPPHQATSIGAYTGYVVHH